MIISPEIGMFFCLYAENSGMWGQNGDMNIERKKGCKLFCLKPFGWLLWEMSLHYPINDVKS
jgi:hypothetical protein